MIHPEKNDVDISKLFNWGSQFAILDELGKEIVSVYLRLVGDADINRARVFALRKSAELRKRLKDEDSDERVAFISSVYELEDKAGLVDLICSLATRKIIQDVIKETEVPFPKEPKSDAPQEDFEKYQLDVDNYTQKRNLIIGEKATVLIDKLKESLMEKELDAIQKLYETKMIDELCEQEMVEKFRLCCVYYGAYTDDKYSMRMFKSFDQFDNLPTEIKQQYIAYYNTLEINIDDLKKLLGATQ
jgi:hypothetical protein